MVFAYHAREAGTGREVRGTIDAATDQAAIAALCRQNLFVLEIHQRRGGNAVFVGNSEKTVRGRIKRVELAAFTRQLAGMLDAGLTIMQALQTLGGQAASPKMHAIIEDIQRQIDIGDSFSGALQRHPDVFDRLYTNMVDAGERGGILPEILNRLATHSERTNRLTSKVRSSMMYPTVVTVVALGVIAFLLIQVVPTFSAIFKEQGASLPAFTAFVISISEFFKHNLLWIAPVVVGIFIGFHSFIRTKKGHFWWDGWKLKLPVVGPIFHKLALTRFAYTTASLIHSGVPILEVLNVVSQTVGNVQMEEAIKGSITKIENGESLSGALSTCPLFPKMILRMIVAGEQSGSVDSMLEKLAGYLDEELDNTLGGLSSLIEPILIVFLGVSIGAMVLAMFLPIFDLVNHIR